MSTVAARAGWRLRAARKREPDLDPTSPLKTAAERRNAPIRERNREISRQTRMNTVGRAIDVLVHLLDQAQLGTPVPPPPPPPPVVPSGIIHRDPWAEPQRLYSPAAMKARDWRSLPIPDMWTRRPAKSEPAPLKTHGYGSPVRAGYRG